MDEIYPAALVLSLAGRDKGRKFIVLSVIDENYVLISDGKMRRAEAPKRKKKKHLRLLEEKCAFIAKRLDENGKATNAEIRKALAQLMPESQESKI